MTDAKKIQSGGSLNSVGDKDQSNVFSTPNPIFNSNMANLLNQVSLMRQMSDTHNSNAVSLKDDSNSANQRSKDLLKLAKEDLKKAKESPVEIAKQLIAEAKIKVQEVIASVKMKKELEGKSTKEHQLAQEPLNLSKNIQTDMPPNV